MNKEAIAIHPKETSLKKAVKKWIVFHLTVRRYQTSECFENVCFFFSAKECLLFKMKMTNVIGPTGMLARLTDGFLRREGPCNSIGRVSLAHLSIQSS